MPRFDLSYVAALMVSMSMAVYFPDAVAPTVLFVVLYNLFEKEN